MRHVPPTLLAIAVTLLWSPVEGEAACPVQGEYRVTGPTYGGTATFSETTFDESSSSGTVVLTLGGRHVCPVCGSAGFVLTGEYLTYTYRGACYLGLNLFDPLAKGNAQIGGTVAFGGAVILFEYYVPAGPPVRHLVNLMIGIRRISSSDRRNPPANFADSAQSFGGLTRRSPVLRNYS